MANWYVSSVVYALVPVWQASHVYVVGDFIKPTAPASGREYVFRCTTAGTSGASEPSYAAAIADGSTVVSGGATFTNVSGRSAHGWAAAAGSLGCMTASVSNRASGGDRFFLSSDHIEATNVSTFGFGTAAFLLIQFLSVNRAGSVPPVAADLQSGASISTTGSNFIIDNITETFWQGISIVGKTGVVAGNILFSSTGSGVKAQWFKDCAISLPSTATSKIWGDGSAQVTFENCTLQVGNTASGFSANNVDSFTWLGGSLLGPTVPSALCATSVNGPIFLTARGVDLSLLTGNIINASIAGVGYSKVLLDSCKIAAGVTRIGTTGTNAGEELELVNCHDGTNVINERHSLAGSCIADHVTYINSGAQDSVGNYSFKLAPSTRADKRVLTLDTFWLDVENTLTGASKTATVEISSAASLNNDDISLLLEYMGAAGSSLTSFVNSLPSPLATPAVLPSSSNAWNSSTIPPVTWNQFDKSIAVTISGGGLTATSSSTNTGVRATQGFSADKLYCEFTYSGSGYVGFAQGGTVFNSTNFAVMIAITGWIQVNGSSVLNIGSMATQPICAAIDFGANLIWFRSGIAGNWNGNATYNPATGVGGVSFSVVAGVLFPAVSMMLNAETVTFTPGSVAGAVPSGFTVINNVPLVKQKLQATFTPQRAGRVRGLVRIGKASTNCWVNPQLSIS